MSEPTAIGHVAHSIDGRTRLCFPAIRGDEKVFDHILSALVQLPGVTAADGRRLTGSVIVHHKGTPFESIRRAGSVAEIFALADKQRASPPVGDLTLSPRLLVALALAGLAVVQVTRGNALPPTITLLWYAAELIRTSGAEYSWNGGSDGGVGD